MGEDNIPEYAKMRNMLKKGENSDVLANPQFYSSKAGQNALAVETGQVPAGTVAAAEEKVKKIKKSGSSKEKKEKKSKDGEEKPKKKKSSSSKPKKEEEEATRAPPPPADSDDDAPPPPPGSEGFEAGGDDEEDPTAKLLAEIKAMGEGGRSGLKKAEKNAKGSTADTVVVMAPKKEKKAAPAANKAEDVKPPKLALEGKKWYCEYQVDNREIVIEPKKMTESIMIYKCTGSLIQIKGKCNSLVCDSLTKCQIIYETALSSVDMTNCKECQIQVTGVAPSFNIDNSDVITYYMSQEAVEKAYISSSKVSNVILARPDPKDPEDMTEEPIPECFITTFKDGGWATEAVKLED